MIGLTQPGTDLGTDSTMIGSLNTVPPRILRIVPLGDFHIFLSLNSSTRASSGVIVAHLIPTPYLRMASAASKVTLSSVSSLYSRPVGGNDKSGISSED